MGPDGPPFHLLLSLATRALEMKKIEQAAFHSWTEGRPLTVAHL